MLVLLRIRIGAEDFDEGALRAEFGDGAGDLAVFRVAVAIDEEEIFPRLALAGAGFDFRHVQFEFAKRAERAVQRADLVRDAEHDAGAVVAGGRAALAAQDEKNG